MLAGQALVGQGRITALQAELVAVRHQLARLERRERRVEREVGRHRRQVDLASRPEVVKSVIRLSGSANPWKMCYHLLIISRLFLAVCL